MLCERNIETKAEKLKLGFLGMSMHAQTQACVLAQQYAYTYFEPAYVCRKHAHADTPQNPNLETETQKNRAETKTKETNNLTCFKKESY